MFSKKLADRWNLHPSGKATLWLIPVWVVVIAFGFWLTPCLADPVDGGKPRHKIAERFWTTKFSVSDLFQAI